MKIKQAILKNINGNEVLTTWLDVQSGLKTGAIVSLKDFKPDDLIQRFTDERCRISGYDSSLKAAS